ncbi:hypothetical protein CFAM422_010752 [Trichoderma lentiforme]|uniref:Uncharacterized protein n=1 Tax=Trichoderma lentiforme TaxID=1567552 RepID=A0A9P5CA20_9HYPO|nr:hypothetical protein CFAM422_010752 [Trichoderma lentiforme]
MAAGISERDLPARGANVGPVPEQCRRCLSSSSPVRAKALAWGATPRKRPPERVPPFRAQACQLLVSCPASPSHQPALQLQAPDKERKGQLARGPGGFRYEVAAPLCAAELLHESRCGVQTKIHDMSS